MTRPLETHEEKAAAMRARQAALRTLERRKKKIEKALEKAQNFSVAGALKRARVGDRPR
jgi:hypothetical protein